MRALFQQIEEHTIPVKNRVDRLIPMVRVCLGCQFPTGFTRTLGEFAANRYLLNSVGIDEIPGANEIGLASVTGELSTHFSISEIDMQ